MNKVGNPSRWPKISTISSPRHSLRWQQEFSDNGQNCDTWEVTCLSCTSRSIMFSPSKLLGTFTTLHPTYPRRIVNRKLSSSNESHHNGCTCWWRLHKYSGKDPHHQTWLLQRLQVTQKACFNIQNTHNHAVIAYLFKKKKTFQVQHFLPGTEKKKTLKIWSQHKNRSHNISSYFIFIFFHILISFC